MSVKEDLENIYLTEDQEIEIKNAIDNNFTKKQYNYYGGNYESVIKIFSDLYKMRYMLEYSTKMIAEYCGKNPRAIRNRLKAVGWEMDRCESQQRASKMGYRNHSKIMISKKRKSLQALVGSDSEDYVRHKLNLDLSEKLDSHEVIVGVNNISILSDRECDIPLIIIKNNKVVGKYIIEFNGLYWHKDKIESDLTKREDIESMGYKFHNIIQFGSTKTQREYGSIDDQIDGVIKSILKDVGKFTQNPKIRM